MSSYRDSFVDKIIEQLNDDFDDTVLVNKTLSEKMEIIKEYIAEEFNIDKMIERFVDSERERNASSMAYGHQMDSHDEPILKDLNDEKGMIDDAAHAYANDH